MKIEIKVPAMGESITEAIVGTIIKPSGTQVQEEDEVLELETDKVNQVLYAPKSGVITIDVKPEDVVTIGQVIGHIDTEGEASESKTEEKPQPEEKPKPVEEKAAEPKPETPPARDKAAPGARLDKEEYIKGLHKPKKVTAPVAPKQKIVAEGEETRRRMPKIRRVIAQRLMEVQQTTAMLTTFNEVDLSEVIAMRNKHKDEFVKAHGVKLGFMSFFIKAALSALEAFPDVNSYIDGDEIVTRHYYNIGIAVGTDRGLIVPVLRDCNHLTFSGIEQAIANYAKKAREGSITIDDLQGGGFTITNGGVYGSLLSTPILNPPQSGILGMHNILERPIALKGEVVIRPMMYLALSYDHRIIDGKEAVSFLVHMKNYLEDPAKLLLDT